MRALAASLRFADQCRVGDTHLDVRISNPAEPRRSVAQRLIVDSGAVYSVVPTRLLREIGLKPDRLQRFELADGRVTLRSWEW